MGKGRRAAQQAWNKNMDSQRRAIQKFGSEFVASHEVPDVCPKCRAMNRIGKPKKTETGWRCSEGHEWIVGKVVDQ